MGESVLFLVSSSGNSDAQNLRTTIKEVKNYEDVLTNLTVVNISQYIHTRGSVHRFTHRWGPSG